MNTPAPVPVAVTPTFENVADPLDAPVDELLVTVKENVSTKKTAELMKAAGKKYEPVIYKGAGHGFMREGEMPSANEANKKAREDAWVRWKGLLKQL